MQLLTIEQASERTGISKSRLYKLTAPAVGAIPTYKIGASSRIDEKDLEAFIATKRRPSRQEQQNKAILY